MMKRAILAIALAVFLAGGAAQAQCKGGAGASCPKSGTCCQKGFQHPSIHDPANIWYRGPQPEGTLASWFDYGGGGHRHHGRQMQRCCRMQGGPGPCMEGPGSGQGMMPGCGKMMQQGCCKQMMRGGEKGMMPGCGKGMMPGCGKGMMRGGEKGMMPGCGKMMKPRCGMAPMPESGQTPPPPASHPCH